MTNSLCDATDLISKVPLKSDVPEMTIVCPALRLLFGQLDAK